jgi:NitT/TauT family transport system substrate-binding protein
MKRRDFISTLSVAAGIPLISTGCSTTNSRNPNSAGNNALNAVNTAKVRIGFSAWPGWFPWQVAKDQGIFPVNKGIELRWYDNYSESITALNEGKIDANSQTLGDTIAAVANGANLVVVLVNDHSTGNDKIIVSDKIKTIQDLKNKTVAVEEGTVDHFLLLQGLQSAGLKASDITILPLETSQAVRAFTSNKTDVVGCFAPFTSTALQRKKSKELFSSKNYPGSISDHLVFSRSYVEQNPDRVQAVVNAWFKTLKRKDSVEAIKIMAKLAGTSTTEYRNYAKGTRIFNHADNLKAFSTGSSMDYLNHAAQVTAKFLKDGNMIKNQPDLTGLFDDQFVKAYSG